MTNRNAVGLGNFPLLYPNNGLVPRGLYQQKVLETMEAPYYVNGRVEMAPSLRVGQPHRATRRRTTPIRRSSACRTRTMWRSA